MTELTLLGRCPTCNQPRVQVARCTCGDSATVHVYGTGKKSNVRSYCTRYGCDCKQYEEAS